MKPFSFVRAPGQPSNLATPMRRSRVFLVLAIFAAWGVLIAGRLAYLQLFEHTEWVARAATQQQRTFAVAPRRGILYDRDLHELAMTVSVDSVYTVPGEIPREQRPAFAAALARVLHTNPADRFTEPAEILKRINSSRYFTWIARKQDPQTIAAVRALKLKGVYLQKEFKRFYPENRIAAQVLGFVGTDESGLGGVEQRYDKQLHGEAGHMLTALDARRHVLGSVEREPEPGANLQLTLDANIQFMAEQALDHAMERSKPLSGTIIVQDPHTGQILALAIRPTFDPNKFRYDSQSLLRDHAVSDVYEPGSAFKLVTYSAALDSHVTTPQQKIDCEGGKIDVAGRIVHDDHYNGVLTTEQALAVSSDVAAIKLAQRMGKDTFYSYIHAFGFGQRSGIELPGETRGLLKPPERWQPTTIGSVPMGHEIAVTPIQLVTMASTIANGGMYLPPRIVLAATDKMPGGPGLKQDPFHPGDSLPDPLPAGAHRVISTLSASEMAKLMKNVVVNGTGKPAQLNGYSAGGKTGTAQKIDVRTHTYSHTKHVTSFVGFAPINDPAVTIAVIIDQPSVGSTFGAGASAPVFQELAQQILEYLGVPHDEPVKSAPELQKIAANPGREDISEPVGDLQTLFAEVNDLPADDPLRRPVEAAPDPALEAAAGPEPASMPTQAHTKPAVYARTSEGAKVPRTETSLAAENPATAPGTVRLEAGHDVLVPDLIGASLRGATEKTGEVGLGLQAIGSGLARAQAPQAGRKVPAGTEVVVRFAR